VQGRKLKADLLQSVVIVVIERFAQNKVINQNMSLVSFRHDEWPFSDLWKQTAMYTRERWSSSSLGMCRWRRDLLDAVERAGVSCV